MEQPVSKRRQLHRGTLLQVLTDLYPSMPLTHYANVALAKHQGSLVRVLVQGF